MLLSILIKDKTFSTSCAIYILISSVILYTRKTPMISFTKDHKGIHYVLLLLVVPQNNHKLCTFHSTDVHSFYRFPSVLYRENHLLFHLDQSDQYSDRDFQNIHQRPFPAKGTFCSAFCVLVDPKVNFVLTYYDVPILFRF